jgi:hypothetical protein
MLASHSTTVDLLIGGCATLRPPNPPSSAPVTVLQAPVHGPSGATRTVSLRRPMNSRIEGVSSEVIPRLVRGRMGSPACWRRAAARLTGPARLSARIARLRIPRHRHPPAPREPQHRRRAAPQRPRRHRVPQSSASLQAREPDTPALCRGPGLGGRRGTVAISGTPCRRRSSPTTHPYPSQPNPPNPFLGDALRSVLAMTSVLGINPRESPWNGPAVHAQRSERALDALVSGALEERARARASGDFASADAIRDMLMTAGVVVSDAAEGTSWSLGARHPPRAQQVGVRPRGAR